MNLNKKSPLLSIIVPTKDRFEYAQFCISSLLEISSLDLEIVVVDNGFGNELSNWIEKLTDSRLLYHRIVGWVSVIDNFETGLKIANGNYLCTIGDDDGVNPEIMEVVKWADNEKFDAIIPSLSADYSWPDLKLKYYGSVRSGLLRWNKVYKSPFKPNLNEEVLKCMKSGGQSFGFMPKIYYGIVKKDCVDEIVKKAGRFFLGVSPDMCASVALACIVKNPICVDYPVFVPGSSAKSTAGSSGMKQHHGSLSEQKHLPANCEDSWPIEVPMFFAVQTVWSQSAIATIKALHRLDYLKVFNHERLHALCLVFNHKYSDKVVRNYFAFKKINEECFYKSILSFVLALIGVTFKRAYGIFYRLIFKTKEFDYQYSGISDIKNATDELGKQLSLIEVSWGAYVENKLK